MVDLAFQNYNVTKAPGSADLTAFATASRYNVADSRLFTFVVKNKQISFQVKTGDKNAKYQYNNYSLSLHVPPSEISYTYNKELAKSKVRSGWIIERWGDSLVSIEASGRTGLFFKGGEGVTRVDAYKTHAYAELMELFQIFKNNGMSYNQSHGTVDTISDVILMYAGKKYYGSFDAFTFSESADMPYVFNYSFVFVARGDEFTTYSGHYVDIPASTALEANETDDYLKTLNRLVPPRDSAVSMYNIAQMALVEPTGPSDSGILKSTYNADEVNNAQDAARKQLTPQQIAERIENRQKVNSETLGNVGNKLSLYATNYFTKALRGAGILTEPPKVIKPPNKQNDRKPGVQRTPGAQG